MMTLTKPAATLIDALRAGPTSLADIAKSLRILVREARLHVAELEHAGVLANRLDAIDGGTKRARLYFLSPRFLMRERGELAMAAESAPRATLEGYTKATLHIALDEGFGVAMLKKTKKGDLIERILSERAALFPICPRCAEEPVDHAGQVCEVCATPKAKPRGISITIRKRAPRRPSVDLSLIMSPADIAEVTALALSQTRGGKVSQRGAQRATAIWLANRNDGFIDHATLRTLVKNIGVFNSPNFTLNMSKDHKLFDRVTTDGDIAGWTLKSEASA
jgi:hypothetical protein